MPGRAVCSQVTPHVCCALCDEPATRFFVTLDNTLWCVCADDAAPFLPIAAEMDPEQYDFQVIFELEEEQS